MKESKVEKALYLYKHGYNCAQAVVCAYAEDFNMNADDAYRLSEGFGSGIPGLATICGAASGLVMLTGLKLSNIDTSKKSKAITYPCVKELTKVFAERMGAIDCKTLQETKDNTIIDGKRAGCIECVKCAAMMVEEKLYD